MLSNEEIVDLLKKIKSLSNNKLKTKSVNVGTFKVNCEWNAEMVKDISKFHNIDYEEELRAILDFERKKLLQNCLSYNFINIFLLY